MDQQQGSQQEKPQSSQATPQDVQQPAQLPPEQTASPTNETKTQTSETSQKGKSKNTYVLIGVALLVIVLGGVYLFASRHRTPQTLTQKTNTAILASPSPAVTPVTSANVDQTINNTDSTVQQTVNQATTDLNSVSNINTSQDSTNGL